MTLLPSLLTSRTKAGADTPKGRQITVVAQVIQVVPVDDDHARRKLGVLIRAERGLRAVVAAERVGAAS
jgi:hypothetical protein